MPQLKEPPLHTLFLKNLHRLFFFPLRISVARHNKHQERWGKKNKQKHHIWVSLRSQILVDLTYNLCFTHSEMVRKLRAIPETFLLGAQEESKSKKALITFANDLLLT